MSFFIFSNTINICYKQVLISTLSLPTVVPKTSLVILVFTISLVDKRLLFLPDILARKMPVDLFFLKLLSSFFADL